MPGKSCVVSSTITYMASLTYVAHSRAWRAWEPRQRMEANIIECLGKCEEEDLGEVSVRQLAPQSGTADGVAGPTITDSASRDWEP